MMIEDCFLARMAQLERQIHGLEERLSCLEGHIRARLKEEADGRRAH